jgi:hypothetical protein
MFNTQTEGQKSKSINIKRAHHLYYKPLTPLKIKSIIIIIIYACSNLTNILTPFSFTSKSSSARQSRICFSNNTFTNQLICVHVHLAGLENEQGSAISLQNPGWKTLSICAVSVLRVLRPRGFLRSQSSSSCQARAWPLSLNVTVVTVPWRLHGCVTSRDGFSQQEQQRQKTMIFLLFSSTPSSYKALY